MENYKSCFDLDEIILKNGLGLKYYKYREMVWVSFIFCEFLELEERKKMSHGAFIVEKLIISA